jgi:hypothetical protein
VSTTKISVTVEDSALAWLRRRAKRVHGGNLSAAIAEAASIARKQEALRAFLDAEGVPPLREDELGAIIDEWRSPPPRGRPTKKRSRR